VILSIESFLPYRNEALNIFASIATHFDTAESRNLLHRFFESLIPFMDRPPTVNQFRDSDWDNFKFIVHELFLYAVAFLIRYERFESAAHLMQNRYYVRGLQSENAELMPSFVVFRRYVDSLIQRNARLKLNRLSLHADLLKERCAGTNMEFRYLQQADFILFMRSRLRSESDVSWVDPYWFPETLVYRHNGPFEVFARSRSNGYFEHARVLLGISLKAEIGAALGAFSDNPASVPRWQYESLNAGRLLGFDKISTEP
jgi:hypothetical protein